MRDTLRSISSPGKISADEDIVIEGIALRARYGEFWCGKVTKMETPGLGYAVAYHGTEHSEGTIFVYCKGLPEIPDGPMSELVMDEFNQATRELLDLDEYIPGRHTKLIDRYGTGAPDRGREFLCAEFILTHHNTSRRTFLYLTGASNRFVKIRITLAINDPAVPTARNFADAVASELWTAQHKAAIRH